MDKRIRKNVVTGFVGQLVVLILGLIIPRIMIGSYGSDINGLMSTVGQIFTYMTLLEAGIAQSARNALFRPITNNDRQGIAEIVLTAKRYFRKVTLWYALAVFLLSMVVPFLIKSDVHRMTISGIILFEGLSGVITFYFIEYQIALLMADGRGYIINRINTLSRVLGYIVKIIMASLGLNILLVQFGFFMITVGKTVFYQIYFHKEYGWINRKKLVSKLRLKDRKSYIVTEVAWTIFSSTDMIVLSMCVSTQLSSVYAIYNMVFSSLNVMLNSVYNSVTYLLGQTFHEDMKKYQSLHDRFNSIFVGGITVLVCVAYILTIPFIKLYMKDIEDTNYIISSLPLFFCLIQLLSWSRYVSGNLTGVAGYAKQTSYISMMEAVLNIVLSFLLVFKYGILGVLIATTLSLPLKVIWCNYIADRKIMNRTCGHTLKICFGNLCLFLLTIIFDLNFKVKIDTYCALVIWGTILTIIISAVGVIINVICNPDLLNIMSRNGRRNL